MICIVYVARDNEDMETSTASPPGTWRRIRDDSASSTLGNLRLSSAEEGAVEELRDFILFLSWVAPDPGHRWSCNNEHRSRASGHVHHTTSRVASLDMGHVPVVTDTLGLKRTVCCSRVGRKGVKDTSSPGGRSARPAFNRVLLN